jgi:hypothetical protein
VGRGEGEFEEGLGGNRQMKCVEEGSAARLWEKSLKGHFGDARRERKNPQSSGREAHSFSI